MYMKQKYIRQIHCHSCNKIIDRPPSLTSSKYNFCDHKCYAEYKAIKWTKENNPNYSGGDIKLTCVTCGKDCKRRRGNKINKYCSIECSARDRGILHRADKHWNWKGGNDTRYLKKTAPRPRPEICEVCGQKGMKRNGITLDHNHKTGKFRGWLCSNCNTALGLVKENPQILQALIKYLNQENSL